MTILISNSKKKNNRINESWRLWKWKSSVVEVWLKPIRLTQIILENAIIYILKCKQLNMNEKNGFPFLNNSIQSHLLGLRKGRKESMWGWARGLAGGDRAWEEGLPQGQQWENDYIHRLDATNKYTKNLGSQASQCQRRELEIWEKTRMKSENR